MECIKCGGHTRVRDSRITYRKSEFGWVQRRRECEECGHRFKTFEIANEHLNIESEDEDGEEDGETTDL